MPSVVTIYNPKTRLYLCGSKSPSKPYQTTMQENGEAETRHWIWDLEKNTIVNKSTGYALDIAMSTPEGVGSPVLAYPSVHGGENQQWFKQSDGTIESGINGLVLDIKDDKRHVGALLIAWTAHGDSNQQFVIENVK